MILLNITNKINNCYKKKKKNGLYFFYCVYLINKPIFFLVWFINCF